MRNLSATLRRSSLKSGGNAATSPWRNVPVWQNITPIRITISFQVTMNQATNFSRAGRSNEL